MRSVVLTSSNPAQVILFMEGRTTMGIEEDSKSWTVKPTGALVLEII